MKGEHARQITKTGGRVPRESPDGQYLYYQRFDPTGVVLRRIRWSDGEDRELPPATLDRAFAPVAGGVYFISQALPEGPSAIQFLGTDGVLQRVAEIGRPDARPLTVTPDGASLLFTQLDRWGRHVMLVRNWR